MSEVPNGLVNQRLMQHLFSHSKRTAFFNLLLAGIVAFYFQLIDKIEISAHYDWLIAIALLSLARFVIAHKALTKAVEADKAQYPLILSLVLVLTGLVWGYTYFSFYDQASVFMRMFVLLVISGVSSASTVSMAASPACFYGFILPITSVVLIKNIMVGTIESIAVIFVMATFVGFLIIVFSTNRKMLLNNVTMNIKQKDLIEQLKQFNKKLSFVSTTDDLTKLANRRHFSERLLTDWIRAKRSKLKVSMLLFDVDYFKQFNDNYGHLAGDDCLKKVADIIAQAVHRQTDLAARLGGDELAIILFDTNKEAAIELAMGVKRKLEKVEIRHKYSPIANRVTVSVGVCSRTPKVNEDYETIISCADQALYAAKDKGRNCIVSY